MNEPATLFTSACDSPATAPLLSPSRPSRDGGVRWDAFGILGLSLSLSLLHLSEDRSSYLPDFNYIMPYRDMYRSAKLFSNGRLFGTLQRYWRLARRRRTHRERGVLFFLLLSIADILSSCKQTWKSSQEMFMNAGLLRTIKIARRTNRWCIDVSS